MSVRTGTARRFEDHPSMKRRRRRWEEDSFLNLERLVDRRERRRGNLSIRGRRRTRVLRRLLSSWISSRLRLRRPMGSTTSMLHLPRPFTSQPLLPPPFPPQLLIDPALLLHLPNFDASRPPLTETSFFLPRPPPSPSSPTTTTEDQVGSDQQQGTVS